MARIVSEIPPAARAGRKSKYPWAEWFDGRLWELVEGEDFEPSAKTFRVQIHASARSMGVHATIALRGTSIFVRAKV